jgi:hypothetical protein
MKSPIFTVHVQRQRDPTPYCPNSILADCRGNWPLVGDYRVAVPSRRKHGRHKCEPTALLRARAYQTLAARTTVQGKVVELSVLGGLHHDYRRAA